MLVIPPPRPPPPPPPPPHCLSYAENSIKREKKHVERGTASEAWKIQFSYFLPSMNRVMGPKHEATLISGRII